MPINKSHAKINTHTSVHTSSNSIYSNKDINTYVGKNLPFFYNILSEKVCVYSKANNSSTIIRELSKVSYNITHVIRFNLLEFLLSYFVEVYIFILHIFI